MNDEAPVGEPSELDEAERRCREGGDKDMLDLIQRVRRLARAEGHAAGLREGVERAARQDGAGLIAAERDRQMQSEGWTAEHDDQHRHSELAQAAACYAWPPPRDAAVKSAWPWERSWWKPEAAHWPDLLPSQEDRTRSRIRVLVKAGALVAAEIDRLTRARRAPGGGGRSRPRPRFPGIRPAAPDAAALVESYGAAVENLTSSYEMGGPEEWRANRNEVERTRTALLAAFAAKDAEREREERRARKAEAEAATERQRAERLQAEVSVLRAANAELSREIEGFHEDAAGEDI